MTRSPIALFVDRPVLTLMVALTLCSLGVLSLINLPLRLAPADMSSANINVYIPIQQSMTPREVQDRVLEPMEEQLRTIPGIAELRGYAGDSYARVSIEFDNDVDIMLASAEVRDRAQRAKLEWPRGVDRYFTWREDGSSAPLAFFQLLTPERDSSWDDRIERVVQPRLESVDGVGRCEMWGLSTESLRIWFDEDKLIEHRVDYGEVIRRLRADNFVEPVGEVDDGRERYLARVDSRFRTQGDIEEYPIRPGLVIGDVARVERAVSVRDSIARFDGKYTYTGILRLGAGINPVEAGHGVRAAMAELEADPDLQGIGFRFMFDQGALIEDSLDTLLQTSLQGGLLALIALWLFLRNVRATLAVAVAIPLALLVSGSYLFFAGRSLNLLTMAGMTLAVGMVVDNSVVVFENIRRLREQGLSSRDAAVRGAREIVLAITMATSTTIVVILPLVFMSEHPSLRAALAALGMTLSVALAGSLFVALLLLPAALRWVGSGLGDRRITRPARWSPVGLLVKTNRWLINASLRHPIWATVACIGILLSMNTAYRQLDFQEKDGGPFQGGDITLSLEMPRGRSLRDVAEEVQGYEQHLQSRREEWSIDHVAVRFDRTSARFDIMLDPSVASEQRPSLQRKIRAAWPRVPGTVLALRERSGSRGGMGSESNAGEKDSQKFVVRLQGPDSVFLTERALEVAADLAASSAVADVEVDRVEGNQEVVVEVDRQRLSDFGVAPSQLTRVMSSGLRGIELTKFQEADGRDVRLIAEFDAERNPTLVDVKETRVWSDRGQFQRIEDLTDVRFEQALERISRIDGQTTVQLVGTRAEDVSSTDFTATLRNVMAGIDMPRGYSWSEASYSSEIGAQLVEVGKAAILSTTLVFMLMGVLFESVILPAAILVTVPFALLGAVWSLALFFGSMDVMAGIGGLLLCGIVVNNGIVLLDCINRMRHEGRTRTSAIVRGTRVRLRPIVMTAVTTVVGLLPMAIFGESTGQGVSYVSMSIAVAGGLTVSTVFTPIVVPLAYTFLDDLSRWLHGIVAHAVRPSGRYRVSSAKPQSL